MTAPANRTKSKRKISIRTPKGRTKTQFRKKVHGVQHCAICDGKIHGVPKIRNTDLKGLAKSKKSVATLFGGHLCVTCRRKVIEQATVVNAGIKTLSDVNIKYRPYVAIALGKQA